MKQRSITRFLIFGVAVLVIVGLSPGVRPLHAQTSFGTILGTVTDPSGAAIPGVAITVTNNQTSIARHVTSDSYGNYRVDSILPGMYTIKAEASGFQTADVTNTQVQVAVTTTVNITLQVGTVTQTVEVTAAAPLLQTSSATVGTVVNNASVVTLPLNGRNFTELISLIPGSVGSGGATYQISGGSNYSVSGNRAEQNNFTLDGVYDNEEFFKTYAIQPSIDAIQEFKIQTNITSAEYGQAAGANINVATKSGTNQLHGAVWEFLRNDKLDANSWFRNLNGVPRGAYKRNQYGFAVGGPLIIPKVYDGRDKSFWFFNYEGTKIRQGATATGTLPTAAQLGGDLTDQPDAWNPITGARVQCNGEMNKICTAPSSNPLDSVASPWVQNYIGVFYPKISAAPGAHSVTVINTAPFTQDQYQWTARGDQKITENLSMFARMSLMTGSQISQQGIPGLTEPTVNRMRNFVASFTYIANPTTVIDWKVGYNRTVLLPTANNPAPGWEAFLAAHPISGTPVKSASIPLYPQLQLSSGYSSPYQESFPFITNQYQAMGSISLIRGKHTLKMGMEFLDMRNLDDGNFTSIFQFDTIPTSDPQNVGTGGTVLASWLLGLPSAGLRNLGETQFYGRQPRYAWYFQDDIKVSRKLTLNLGLRYEYDKWPLERWDRVGGMDASVPNGNGAWLWAQLCAINPGSTTFCGTTPPNASYLWTGQNPILNQPPNTRRTVRDPDFNNFAPRIGLAYEFAPNTTFRAGYGIFYVGNYLWEDQGMRGNWPYAISQTLSSRNVPGATVYPITSFFSPDVTPIPSSVPSSQHVLGRLDRTGYAQQWNAGIQRMLTNSLMLEVDYVGSRGVKQSLFTNTNTALPGPGEVGTDAHPRILGNAYGAVSLMANQASSSYHSMQVKLEKRFSNGLQFLSSYTWGKEMDIGGSGFSNSVAPQNPFNWAADRAVGIFNRAQIFTFSYYYQLPFGRGKAFMNNANKFVDAVLGGWEMTGIAHYNTGYPINVGYPGDVANIGPRSGGQRPNWVGGSPRRLLNPNDRRQGWVNQANYAPPALYTFGNAGRNLEVGPGSGYFNPGFLKNFPFGEGRAVQFRAEFFNFWNQHAMGCIHSTYGDTVIGQADCTQQGSREVQFGLKVLF